MRYELNSRVQRVKFAREAARVERVHSSPGLGSYSDGMHTFNMLTMLLILNPEASANLIKAVVQHDIPELLSGDMSYHAKTYGIQNTEAQSELEQNVNEEVFGSHAANYLNAEEKKWLSGLDMIEYYCWCRDQLMLGNRTVEPDLARVQDIVRKNASRYHNLILDVFWEMELDDWHKVPPLGE